MTEGNVLDLDLTSAAQHVLAVNSSVAASIEINEASRATVIKPSGTSTLFFGIRASGIHDVFSGPNGEPDYIRRVRVGKSEPVYQWLHANVPDLLEDDVTAPKLTSVLSIPIKGDEKSVSRKAATVEDFIDRVCDVQSTWVNGGHRTGPMGGTHGVSATAYVAKHEIKDVQQYLWERRGDYRGMTLLPKFDANYAQMPYEACTREVIDDLESKLTKFDPTAIFEADDPRLVVTEGACSGGACEIV
jgi:ribonucleoside-diphosphate reductase alpha chain